MTAAIDAEFQAISEDFVGMLGWRIENFLLAKVKSIGEFYTGDSYVFYHAYIKGTSKRVIRDVYFWLGAESTTDEKGAAAIKAIECDDRFGGHATQHREVQHHESDAFVQLFDEFGGIRYKDGGVDSGFHKVELKSGVEVYQIKGKKNPVLSLVPSKRSSLNHGDVFIIHSPGKYFLWIGNKANRFEKLKGASAISALKKTDPKAEEIRVEDEPNAELDAILGTDGEIQPAADDDSTFETSFIKAIYDSTGKQIAKDTAVSKSLLKSDQLLYVRNGDKLFIFIGKKVDKNVKRTAIHDGMNMLGKLEMPEWAPIEVIYEGTDDDDFELVFQ